MNDPLSDPRAVALLGASTDVIDEIASTLRGVAQVAQESADGLTGAQNDLTWEGDAATAFRAAYAKAPPELDRIAQSYADAAQTVQTYGDTVASLQAQLRSLEGQITSGRAQATQLANQVKLGPDPAITHRYDFIAGVDQLLAMRGPITSDVIQRVLWSRQTGPHSMLMDEAIMEYRQMLAQFITLLEANAELDGRAEPILEAFDQARRTIATHLSSAADLAPKQPPWFLRGVGSQRGRAGLRAAISHALEHRTQAVNDLPAELDAFADHPNWATYEEVVGGLAAVAAAAIAAAGLPTSTDHGALLRTLTGAGESSLSGAASSGAVPGTITPAQRQSLLASVDAQTSPDADMSPAARADLLAGLDAMKSAIGGAGR